MARILIVDDDDLSRDVLAMILQRRSYDVDCAPTGYEAIGSIMKSAPDLVILDLSMPAIDGASVLEIIRSKLELRSLPVVVWTGHEASELADRVRGMEVASIVTKGEGSIDNIVAAVQGALPAN